MAWYCILTNDPHLILYFAALLIGSSIRYIHTLFGNHFLKSYKVNRILISFNCFSEYILHRYVSVIIWNKSLARFHHFIDIESHNFTQAVLD